MIIILVVLYFSQNGFCRCWLMDSEGERLDSGGVRWLSKDFNKKQRKISSLNGF